MSDAKRRPSRAVVRASVMLVLGTTGAVHAMPIDTGNDDLKFTFDNTFKYSAAWRVKEPSAGLLGNPNTDDGDRNFGKGLVSNRVDWLSELDLVYAKRYGLRLSGAAWYDRVYNTENDNPGFAGGAFPNQASVGQNEFTDATRKLHGRKADLLDAFVFGNFDLGEQRASVRLGRHAVLWGESLFFGGNAIAGGMSPVDIVKFLSVPGTQFKEAIRPVPQVSGSLQLTPSLSVGAFYQFRWDASRLPAAGSYFSFLDILQDGAEQLLLGPGLAAPRLADQRARDRGQGGVQLRLRAGGTDYGLYLTRFHSKTPQVVTSLGLVPGIGAVPTGYRLAYHEGITALGASASRTFGEVNVAVEASLRRNQDLASSQAVDASGLAPPGVIAPADNRDNPGYAVGKTAHVNVSAIWTLPRTPLFDEATLMSEVAWNRALSVTKNAAALDPNATRDAVTMRLLLEPFYRQVAGGLDVSVPIGLGYTPGGSRSRALGPGFGMKGGDLTVGLNGVYLDAWRFSLAYTHFFGPEATFITPANTFSYGQSLKDRNFIAFSVRRTF